MPEPLLPEGQKGLSPESVSCRAKTNHNLDDGLWALGRDRKRFERGQRAWCVLGSRTVTEDRARAPRETHASTVSHGSVSAHSSSPQEFLYKAAGGLLHWIGLTKAGSEGDWHWVDDTPFDKVQSAR